MSRLPNSLGTFKLSDLSVARPLEGLPDCEVWSLAGARGGVPVTMQAVYVHKGHESSAPYRFNVTLAVPGAITVSDDEGSSLALELDLMANPFALGGTSVPVSADPIARGSAVLAELAAKAERSPLTTQRGTPEELMTLLGQIADATGTRVVITTSAVEGAAKKPRISSPNTNGVLEKMLADIAMHFLPSGSKPHSYRQLDTRVPYEILIRAQPTTGHALLQATAALHEFYEKAEIGSAVTKRMIENRLASLMNARPE